MKTYCAKFLLAFFVLQLSAGVWHVSSQHSNEKQHSEQQEPCEICFVQAHFPSIVADTPPNTFLFFSTTVEKIFTYKAVLTNTVKALQDVRGPPSLF